MNKPLTLGRVIAERRNAHGFSLKDLGRLVRKEDGQGVSAQYLHDIERDRRTPSPQVLGELARVLGVDVHYLASVAGQCPAEVTDYLRERPECGRAVAALFARAHAAGFSDWDRVSFFFEQPAPAISSTSG